VNPLRSVGGRLALALVIVVGSALVIVYLIVVPFYSHSLVDRQLTELRRTLVLVAAQPRTVAGEMFPSQAWIEDEAEPLTGPLGVRVAIFSAPPLLEPIADSNGSNSLDIVNDPLVLRAATSSRIVSGEVTRLGAEYAEAAASLGANQPVVLVTTPLNSDLASVAVVRRRVIIAGLVATAFATVLGYALASVFARRIRRLEEAAERIADGRFDEVVADAAADELGQLARAFELMRQRLASLERARGEFIANASHELRTPLFSLAGYLELLTEDPDIDVETRDAFVVSMREQVARLTRLASVLLDLSRVDAGRLVVNRESVDLAAVAELLEMEFMPRAAAAGQRLRVHPPEPVVARADEARILQIGRILVDNALVHTPPGTVVAIEARAVGNRALLAVTDDGPGIPDDAQRSVFERFYRLSGSVASGSGLGLAIAHELAGLMRGRVLLESSGGRTTFTLELPLDVAATIAGTEPAGAARG
jgi:signal transduction histidine kinase